jgi:hypothetical protein
MTEDFALLDTGLGRSTTSIFGEGQLNFECASTMKIWLASYPRSGNTFLRLILNQAFGIRSTSVYPSEDSGMCRRSWLMERIGYAGKLGTIDNESRELVAVKTHDPPPDDGLAIYVVRDGRAAITSYRHMLKDYEDVSPTLDELIEGHVWPGSWSAHYKSWNPKSRPNTLFLKFEDVQSNAAAACTEISSFLQVRQKADFTQNFDELNRLEPTLFRSASNDRNIAEMLDHINLFNKLHGDLMRTLGYY